MAEQLDNRVSVTVVCIDADSDGNAASSVAGPVLLGWAGLGNVRQRAACSGALENSSGSG